MYLYSLISSDHHPYCIHYDTFLSLIQLSKYPWPQIFCLYLFIGSIWVTKNRRHNLSLGLKQKPRPFECSHHNIRRFQMPRAQICCPSFYAEDSSFLTFNSICSERKTQRRLPTLHCGVLCKQSHGALVANKPLYIPHITLPPSIISLLAKASWQTALIFPYQNLQWQ